MLYKITQSNYLCHISLHKYTFFKKYSEKRAEIV